MFDAFDLTTFTDWLSQTPWVKVLLVVMGAYLAGRFGKIITSPLIRRAVGRLQAGESADDIKKCQDTLISLTTALFKVVIWTVAIFELLSFTSLNVTGLLAGAGVLGVAVGFGAQSLVKDFLSGMFILLENQYRVGDVVEIPPDTTGTVERITLRSTILRDLDGNVHFVPNGSIAQVVNKTLGFSKINLTIAVHPDTDLDRLIELVNTVGTDLAQDERWKQRIIEPPHFRDLGNFTETSLPITITGTTAPSQQWAVTNELRKRLLVAFRKSKIELAAG